MHFALWKGNYQIEGRAFVYLDRKSGRIIASGGKDAVYVGFQLEQA